MRAKHDIIDMLSINHQLIENDLFKNSNISNSDFDDLKLNIIDLKKGEILFRQGDSVDSIYLIIEGEINLIIKQSFGKTHSCLSKNNFFGHQEYFLQTERNSIAIALNDSRIVELSKDNVVKLLSRDNSILNNIKNSFLDLDSTSIIKFENVIRELPDFVEKSSSVFSMEPKLMDNINFLSDSTDEAILTSDTNERVYNKIDINKLKSEINLIINHLGENLSLLEKEKIKMRTALSVSETDIKELRIEIDKLKEQEKGFISLDKEKTEILGSQSYRIIELEKETVKFGQLETGFFKKIELLNEQVSKDEIRIKKLDAELKDKEAIVSQLENDLEENKKTLSNLNETVLILTCKTDDQERAIKEQKTKLQNSENRIEELTLELSSKKVSLTELNKNLLNKNAIISTLNDNADKVKADLESAQKALEAKDEVIQNQSAKIGELQNKLDYQKESEKNKNEYILNQAHKIAECEDLLKNDLNELAQKDEIINNFIQETQAQTEKVLQKQSLIKDQNRVITELNDEVATLKKSTVDFGNKERDLTNTITDLSFHLSKANSKLISLSEEVNEKNRLAEDKERENSVLQKNFEELNNTLKKKNDQINNLDSNITKLKSELSKSDKLKQEFSLSNAELLTTKEAYNELNNEHSFLSEQIKTLKLQIEESKNESSKLLSINDELKKLKSDFDSNTKAYNELENENSALSEQIKALKLQTEKSKSESSNLESLNADLNKLKAECDSKANAYNELKNENSLLSDQIRTLQLQIKESINQNSNQLRLDEELSTLKSEEEKYKHSIIERDRIIEEQKEQIENNRLAKNETLKTVASTKENFAEEIRKKDNHISELVGKLGQIQNALDEKIFFENQQAETIDNQAQKIAELELLVNEFKVKSNKPTIAKEENVIKTESPQTNYVEPVKVNSDEEIFSKCKLIKTRPVDSSFTDGTFEHYQDIDIQIVNVNLTRATIDVVSIFNEFLQEISSKGKNKIIVNLLSCEFIDSSILGALVSNLKKVTALGGDLRLVGFHPAVKSMMELTRMHRLFEYFPTVEAAMRSFDQ